MPVVGASMQLLSACQMDPREIFKKVQKQEDKKEFSFALEIGYGVVKGAIWAIDQGKAKVFSVSEVFDWQKESSLIEAADKCLSGAIEKAAILEEEPKKIIFGLPSSWVQGEKIIPEKLKILKELCQGLELKPVGFVVTTEALVKYLKTLEGVLPNAILVEVARAEAEVTLLRLGKIIGSSLVKRSHSLGEDIAEALSRIKTEEVLPARIILYNSKSEIEDEKEEVLSYPWLREENGFNFLHLPKTEVFPADFDIRAVALAGGAEVAKAEGIEAEIFLEDKTRDRKLDEQGEKEIEREIETTIEEEKEAEIIEEPSKLGFGFIEEKDIATGENKIAEGKVAKESEVKEFPTKRDQTSTLPDQEVTKKPKKSFFARLRFFHLRRLILAPFTVFRKIVSLIKFPGKLTLLAVIGAVLFVAVSVGLSWLWWFYPKAKVTLFVKPQISEKEFEVTLDSGVGEVDQSKMIVPAKVVEVILEQEKEGETTGIKVIGEKAKGEVIVYNRASTEKKLNAGTILISRSDIKFSIEEGIVVASESAGPDYTRIPGKAKAAVTALVIGNEGNLAAGTEFTVDKYSATDLIARNENAFTEGSSREVKIVGKSDQENLASVILEELKLQATEKLKEKVPVGEVLVEGSITEKILEKKFDKEIQEETDRLKLTLKTSFKALVYQNDKFNQLIAEKVRASVPSGFQFRENESEVKFKLDKVIDEDKALFTASYRASLWPQIDTEQIRKNLRGKKAELGEFYLKGLSNIEGYEVIYTPNLSRIIKTFPRVLKRIDIEVTSK